MCGMGKKKPQKVRAVTPEMRAAAARIRVTADEKNNRQTPQWIRDIAEANTAPDYRPPAPIEHQVAAARIQLTVDRKSGRRTEDWIRLLAEQA